MIALIADSVGFLKKNIAILSFAVIYSIAVLAHNYSYRVLFLVIQMFIITTILHGLSLYFFRIAAHHAEIICCFFAHLASLASGFTSEPVVYSMSCKIK